MEELAQAVARKFLSQQIDEIRRASQEGIEYVLDIAQGFLLDVGLGVQFTFENQVIHVNCHQCQLCYQHEEECFCRDFLEEFVGNTASNDCTVYKRQFIFECTKSTILRATIVPLFDSL